MPSVSQPKRKLMAIAAHTPGGYGGVPQSVGKEFHAADVGKYGHKPAPPTANEHKKKMVAALMKR